MPPCMIIYLSLFEFLYDSTLFIVLIYIHTYWWTVVTLCIHNNLSSFSANLDHTDMFIYLTIPICYQW